jgi:quinol monooxygenase YgiN
MSASAARPFSMIQSLYLSSLHLIATLLLVVFMLLAVPQAWAAGDPTTAAIPTTANDAQPAMADRIHVVGRLAMNLTPQEKREFEQKTVALAAISRTEDAVIAYSCNRDIEDPGTYVFDEIWPSQVALEAHLQTDHFKAWWDWVQPHLARELDVEVALLSAFHRL